MNRHPSAHDPSTDRLIGLLAALPDEAPPAGLAAGVMRRIQPLRLSLWRRALHWMISPLTVVALRPLTVGAAALAVAGLLWVATTRHAAVDGPALPIAASRDQGRLVTFRLEWPEAQKVTVIGSFNHWRPDGHPMQRSLPDGAWQIGIQLPPGIHAYAFVVDDEKIVADPHSLWEQDDGFGHRNSMLSVDNGSDDADRI